MAEFEVVLFVIKAPHPTPQLQSVAQVQAQIEAGLRERIDWFAMSPGHEAVDPWRWIRSMPTERAIRFVIPDDPTSIGPALALHWLRAAIACEAQTIQEQWLAPAGWRLLGPLPSLEQVLVDGDQLGPFIERDGRMQRTHGTCRCWFCSTIGWREPVRRQLLARLRAGEAVGSVARYAQVVAKPDRALIEALLLAAGPDSVDPVARAITALVSRATPEDRDFVVHRARHGPPNVVAAALPAVVDLARRGELEAAIAHRCVQHALGAVPPARGVAAEQIGFLPKLEQGLGSTPWWDDSLIDRLDDPMCADMHHGIVLSLVNLHLRKSPLSARVVPVLERIALRDDSAGRLAAWALPVLLQDPNVRST
ncbi:MAG: hypothetical protein AAGA48_18045 [Myxococcota bacterium]